MPQFIRSSLSHLSLISRPSRPTLMCGRQSAGLLRWWGEMVKGVGVRYVEPDRWQGPPFRSPGEHDRNWGERQWEHAGLYYTS